MGVRVLGHGSTDPRASGSCSGLRSTLCSSTAVQSCAAVQTLPFAFRLMFMSHSHDHVTFPSLYPWDEMAHDYCG